MSNVAETHFGLLPEESFRPQCGRMKLYGKGGGGSPSPDPRIGQAAVMSAQTGQSALDFLIRGYEESKPRQEKIDQFSDELTRSQIDLSNLSAQTAKENAQRYKDKFVPVEDQYLDEVAALGGRADQARAAGAAAGDVESQSAMQRSIADRNLMSMGVNPNAGKFMAVNRANELMTMAARAGAMTSAREGARSKGIAARASAANLGRGFMADTNAATGAAIAAAGGAGNSAMTGNNYLTARQGAVGSGYGTAMEGYGQQANILGQQYAADTGLAAGNAAAKAGTRSAVAGAAGTAIVMI